MSAKKDEDLATIGFAPNFTSPRTKHVVKIQDASTW